MDTKASILFVFALSTLIFNLSFYNAAENKNADLSPRSPLLLDNLRLEGNKKEESINRAKESNEKDKSLRMGKTGVIVGVIVGVCVVVAIVVPCVLLIPNSSSANSDLPPFAFEDLYSGKYSYRSLYPNWDESTPVNTDFLTLSDGAVVRRDVTKPDENIEQLAPKSQWETWKANNYYVSADAKFIAYRSNYQKVWRHSWTADFNIWDVENQREVTTLALPKTIQHLEWAPNSDGHRLAIVHDFTVHMVDDIGSATPTLVQVSPTGARNMDYYGIPDWMYEEEMISSNNVLYWSPSASRLAYLHTNEQDVTLIEYSWFGDGQYPQTIDIAYPKAGSKIGTATLWVYDIASSGRWPLLAPAGWIGQDHYFSRFTWLNDTACLATWTDRFQTVSIAQLCILNEAGSGFDCNTEARNQEDMNGEGWVGSFGPFYPLWRTDSVNHDYFTIYTRPNANGNDGYWQLAYVGEDNVNPRWMTNTGYDIVGVDHYDSASGYVYFTAVYNEARRRQIMRVLWNAEDETEPQCATCGLWEEYPERCGWVTPSFSPEGRSVVINCRGNMVPLTLLYDIGNDGAWTNKRELYMNEELQTSISEVKWPRREYRQFKSDKYEKPFNYEIWFPSDFDETKKYPLMIEVYAGIEFQKVQDTWRRGFSQTYMVSNREMIVASVDGRGSAYEGFKFMRQNYRMLGQNEPVDQTDFAKYLRDTYSYIDPDRIAIWGWSYGGYTTSHTLGLDAGNTFKCGIAVAPLADWYWYDAMYAERYMNDPTENAVNYEKASIIKGHDLANFKNSEYTLIHGMADDNVHFQSAAEMEKALVNADVDFDAFFYADEAHSVNTAENANRHIYHQIDMRLSHCLGRVDNPYGSPNK